MNVVNSLEWDVVIAGAGPCGLTLANHLGTLGVRTLVLEALPELIDYPRGVGMDDESLRSFQAVRVVDQIRRHTVPHQAMRFVDRRGRELASVNPLAQPFGWPRRSGFIQPLIDRQLADALHRFEHVRLAFSRSVQGVDDLGDHVRIQAQPVDAQGSPVGEPEVIRAQFLIGCDGGRSAVRGMLGLPFDGQSESTKWLVVDLANDPIGLPNLSLVLDDSFPHVNIALPHGIRRFEFMVQGDKDEALYAQPEHIQALLRRVLPQGAEAKVIRHRVYTHHARIAPTFRKGRVFLAGDAAHLMPVWQGQGFNTGIRDATNLGWKLALVAQGKAGPALLESYTQERHAHAAAMIDLSVLVGKIFVPANGLLRGVRNLLAPLIAKIPPLRRYITEMRFKPMPFFQNGAIVHGQGRPTAPAVGRMFIQPWVADAAGKAQRLDDAIGLRFALISWSASVDGWLSPASRRVLDTLGAASMVIRPSCQDLDRDVPAGGEVLADRDGELRRWFDTAPGSVLLLRPDRVVAAVCMPCELDACLKELAKVLDLAGSPARPSAQPMPSLAQRTKEIFA
ncbi:MAG: bifunctional 3-(3-hydroxy-phenyl)propionate/3-hydroxycinnamic acid hydroxylase [Ottowia sp.]|uniref:bifunctional 3-(3-hydroxy-phenyl)propionate/3-hydroxycinnamic acid hydroxylase n=1 Tax=Ottowia sp. TaxID=1898956 RepID=UPI003C75E1AC